VSSCHEVIAPWWQWHPPTGVFISFVAVVVVLVPWFRGTVSGREKAFWTFLMFLFVGLEIRTIYLDSAEHDGEEALARCQQLESFQKIAVGIERAINQSQQQFAATMGESAKIFGTAKSDLDAVTGGDTFVEFDVIPNTGEGNPPTFPMIVSVVGKYPIRNMAVQIQKIRTANDEASIYKQLQSIHMLPVGGDLLPGSHFVSERLGLGRYDIGIWAANGTSDEELELKLNEHGQLQQSYEVHRGKKALVKVKDGNLIFRRHQP
jgi:hypothetical protein